MYNSINILKLQIYIMYSKVLARRLSRDMFPIKTTNL